MIQNRVGRPNDPSIKDGKIISVYLEKELLKDFGADCKEQRISVSRAMRDLVREHLEKNALGPQNPIGVKFIDSNKLSRFTDPTQIWTYRAKMANTKEEFQSIRNEVRGFRNSCTAVINIVLERENELGMPHNL